MQLLAPLVLLIPLINAQYELQSSFSGLTFFDNFEFYTSWDPTYGYVQYVDRPTAEQYGMINVTEESVSFGVDTMQTLDPDSNLGRVSLRLTTIQSWTHGLFILDLAHMPANTCGVWPAVWMLGSGLWPTTGEIDIIEFVNNGENNLMAMHTSEGCTVAGTRQTGTLLTSDCGADGGFTGCTVSTTLLNNSGITFNENGGGVYAMEWTSSAIRTWFFPRNAIPESIVAGAPDVHAFGLPSANFQGACDIDSYFSDMSLVFNIDFCGQYAGNVWQTNGCPMLDPENGWASCNEFVALNPSAYTETYWKVNYLDVYQIGAGATPAHTTVSSSVIPAISTSSVDTALSGALGRTDSFTITLAATVPELSVGFSETAANSKPDSALPFTPIPTPPSVVTPEPPRLSPPTSLPATPVPPPPSLGTTAPCTDTICTSQVVVTVTQTITVGGVTLIEIGPSKPPQHAIETEIAWNSFDLCNFQILTGASEEHPQTAYECTLTREEIFNGQLATQSAIASTAIPSNAALHFGNLLSIGTIVVETDVVAPLTKITPSSFTGSFTPSGTVIRATSITAYPEQPSSSMITMRTTPSDSPLTPAALATLGRRDEDPHTLLTLITGHRTLSGGKATSVSAPSQIDEEEVDETDDMWWIGVPIIVFLVGSMVLLALLILTGAHPQQPE